MFSFFRKKTITQEECELKVSTELENERTVVQYFVNKKEIFRRVFRAIEYGHKQLGDKIVIKFCSRGKDADKFYFIDMRENKEIFTVIPEFDWPKNFILEDERLFLIEDYGRFSLTSKGKLSNRLEYLKAHIDYVGYKLVYYIKELFETQKNTDEDIRYYLLSLDKYIDKNRDSFNSLQELSLAYQLKAQIYEFIEDYYNACFSYKIALGLNGRIGVKRNIKKVSTKLDDKDIENIDNQTLTISQQLIELNKRNKDEIIARSHKAFSDGVKSGRILIS